MNNAQAVHVVTELVVISVLSHYFKQKCDNMEKEQVKMTSELKSCEDRIIYIENIISSMTQSRQNDQSHRQNDQSHRQNDQSHRQNDQSHRQNDQSHRQNDQSHRQRQAILQASRKEQQLKREREQLKGEQNRQISKLQNIEEVVEEKYTDDNNNKDERDDDINLDDELSAEFEELQTSSGIVIDKEEGIVSITEITDELEFVE
jgi:hypothetical protein